MWLIPVGVSLGLAVLAKGPVGLVLPMAVSVLFSLWAGKLRLMWTWGCVLGALLFVLVALPWYVWVGIDTKTDFLQGFFMTHNVGRYLRPMENHGGPIYYYLIVMAVGFAPWSAFLGLVVWQAFRDARFLASSRGEGLSQGDANATRSLTATRFLACWIVVYLVFFSLSGTKLPNYILPIYAPLAILTARFLEQWRA